VTYRVIMNGNYGNGRTGKLTETAGHLVRAREQH
jgi:hypothetical protein